MISRQDAAKKERQLQKLPGLAELQAKITRKVPVVLLERKKERERTQEKRRDL